MAKLGQDEYLHRSGYASDIDRLGAALRLGARPMVQRASRRKLLLTDGEAADVDVNDPHYLAQDARQVVRVLEAQGVFVWCIQLHPAHEESVRTVFGEHYTLVNLIEQLPQVLAGLFLRLTGSLVISGPLPFSHHVLLVRPGKLEKFLHIWHVSHSGFPVRIDRPSTFA